ncbi:hypothetical protein JRO89_XS01G0234200 [Xanthoceras sorbifolium]|uniref:Uncharacterized protein n=1 Tax=Xanthoceras sorbifolium TaxID=99658 RepID=A0ABQ8IKU2_9ROSI|nr:hypothetical protein JRO89_XS01G0234200 [Xanthoceras sorbifolium]
MAETETKNVTSRMRQRPIVRLGILLISHSILVSIICCTAGVLALLLLPVLAKNSYISENALMPGSASSMLSYQDVLEANKLVRDISSLSSKPSGVAIESRGIIAQYMSDLGAEVNYHKFHPHLNEFHPLHFFSSPGSEVIQDNFSCSLYGVNTVGIIRAPRGDGKEAIVLVTPYDSVRGGVGEALSLGIAYSVFSLLARVTWLAKDIIWLVADSQYGEYAPVTAWLRDYHTPVFGDLGSLNSEMCDNNNNIYKLKENSIQERNISYTFKRAGTMAAALVLKVAYTNEQFEDTLSIYAEASNGQMPNLDLINIVNYLAVHKQGLRVKVEKFWSLLESQWLRFLGEIFESLGKLAKSLNPDWKFGISPSDYVEGTATLASSLYYQALGVPTGCHGAFRDYQVDAITLEISPKVNMTNMIGNILFILRNAELYDLYIYSVKGYAVKTTPGFWTYRWMAPEKVKSVNVLLPNTALNCAPSSSVTCGEAGGVVENETAREFETARGDKDRKWHDEMDENGKPLRLEREEFGVRCAIVVFNLLNNFLSHFLCLKQFCKQFRLTLASKLLLLMLVVCLCVCYACVIHVVILKSAFSTGDYYALIIISRVLYTTIQFKDLIILSSLVFQCCVHAWLMIVTCRSFFRRLCCSFLAISVFIPATHLVTLAFLNFEKGILDRKIRLRFIQNLFVEFRSHDGSQDV